MGMVAVADDFVIVLLFFDRYYCIFHQIGGQETLTYSGTGLVKKS